MSGGANELQAKLEELRIKLEKSPRVAAKIADRVADRFSQLAQAAYDSQRSVYGVPFQNGSDLRESGRLRSEALRYRAAGTQVRASVAAVPYAKFHLKNGLLPASGKVPGDWLSEIDRIAEEEIKKELDQ